MSCREYEINNLRRLSVVTSDSERAAVIFDMRSFGCFIVSVRFNTFGIAIFRFIKEEARPRTRMLLEVPVQLHQNLPSGSFQTPGAERPVLSRRAASSRARFHPRSVST